MNKKEIIEFANGYAEAWISIGKLPKDGDGLTVEIHNYIKDLTKKEMYSLLKKSTVVTYKETTITGQITSAFFDDKIYFKK